MTTVHCPQCGEPVSTPETADDQARVRCPLCLAEYPLADALAQLPPALIVVADAETEASRRTSQATSAALPAIEIDDHPGSAAPEDGARRIADFEFQTRPPPALDTSGSPTRYSSGTHRARRPRQPKSPLREMVKIVLGGLVGLTLGQLILWWAMKRDPFAIAPQVGRVVPWVVPETFQVSTPPATATQRRRMPAFGEDAGYGVRRGRSPSSPQRDDGTRPGNLADSADDGGLQYGEAQGSARSQEQAAEAKPKPKDLPHPSKPSGALVSESPEEAPDQTPLPAIDLEEQHRVEP